MSRSKPCFSILRMSQVLVTYHLEVTSMEYSKLNWENSSVLSVRRPTNELNPFTKSSETDLGLTISAITLLGFTNNFHKNEVFLS